MARRTDGEKIDEMTATVALLIERSTATLKQLAKLDEDLSKYTRDLADLRREHEKEIALMKRELDELKKWKDDHKKEKDEWARRIWAFGPNLIAAIVSGIIAALVAYFVARP
jgi:hypothetical protein